MSDVDAPIGDSFEAKVRDEERRRVLDYLLWLGVINYSRLEDIYFVNKDGYMYVIE